MPLSRVEISSSVCRWTVRGRARYPSILRKTSSKHQISPSCTQDVQISKLVSTKRCERVVAFVAKPRKRKESENYGALPQHGKLTPPPNEQKATITAPSSDSGKKEANAYDIELNVMHMLNLQSYTNTPWFLGHL